MGFDGDRLHVHAAVSLHHVTPAAPVDEDTSHHVRHAQITRIDDAYFVVLLAAARVDICLTLGNPFLERGIIFFDGLDLEPGHSLAGDGDLCLGRNIDQKPPDAYRLHLLCHLRHLGSVPHTADLAGSPCSGTGQSCNQNDELLPSARPRSRHGIFCTSLTIRW
ncbi:hypothetical protein P0M04_27670 [Telluria mixta]|nr:hypothetical protein [Telluria mixta]WEM95222.1 hypothetical protein P0M04_27670 [Telluria mixta]